MIIRYCLFIVLSALCIVAAPSSNNENVQRLLANRHYTSGQYGISIYDITHDSLLTSLNADTPLNPASLSKLLTGATAFELLSPTYVFSTAVYYDGILSRDSATLYGNLYIKGKGDPGLVVEKLWLFVQHLQLQGVRAITGDIIIDDSWFDTLTAGPGFDDDRSSRAYNAPVSALAVNFSSVSIMQAPGDSAGSPVFVATFPRMYDMPLISRAITVPLNGRTTIDVRTQSRGNITTITTAGTLKQNDPPRLTYRKVFQSRENFGRMVLPMLDESGIRLGGKITFGRVSDSLLAQKPLYEFSGEALTQAITDMFKYSTNFVAEMVFKTVAATALSAPGTWEKGSTVINRWWLERKLPGQPILKNGSGMGDANRLSASQITALLAYTYKQKQYWPDYLSALSNAGFDGTLKTRFVNSPLKGMVRAKTGTLNNYGASGLAGYVLLPDRTCAFAIMFSGAGTDMTRHWATQELILNTVLGR